MTETAWLIEARPSVSREPRYWGPTMDASGTTIDFDWTGDHNRAVRFARQQDAQQVIDYYGWTEADPVEHQWG